MAIESAESVGQFLHTSALPLEELHPDAAYREINLTVQKSSFVVQLHAGIMDVKSDVMKGGAFIQLFHKVRVGALIMTAHGY